MNNPTLNGSIDSLMRPTMLGHTHKSQSASLWASRHSSISTCPYPQWKRMTAGRASILNRQSSRHGGLHRKKKEEI
jgi:hypothetical protein